MSTEVQQMFASIARRYDSANDVLSLGVHRTWRRTTVRLSGAAAGELVLDCAAGTGDLALAFAAAVGAQGRVVATDFCAEMLTRARQKADQRGRRLEIQLADVLELPFSADTFDVASIGFGIRNVDDPLQCLREMARVVRPGGRVVVLEFGQPWGVFGALFRWYSRRVMPGLGGALTGRPEAYQYLPRTAAAFPAGDKFLELMDNAAVFQKRTAHPLLAGTAYVYLGTVAG